MKLTCIMCPMGCELNVSKKGKDIVVTGNTCVRGESYGKEELTEPKRVLTGLVKTKMGVVSVKTTKPIPKQMLFDVNAELGKVQLNSARFGQVIIKNVLNTGADIVVTSNF